MGVVTFAGMSWRLDGRNRAVRVDAQTLQPYLQEAMRVLGGCKDRREGDEMACSCGKRWPIGEDHP